MRSSFLRFRSFTQSPAFLICGALITLASSEACAPGSEYIGGSGGGNSEGTFSGSSHGGAAGTFSNGTAQMSSGIGGGCAGTSVTAQKIPLDMFIMLDQSGSMDESVSGGGTKWTAVTQALTSFVQSPDAAGLGVGIQYFGLPAGGGTCPSTCLSDADCGACGPCLFPGIISQCFGAADDSCDANDYSGAEVEIAPLPGNAQPIITSMGMHAPTTGTPTSAALQGAIIHAKAWQASHPDHVVVHVFATDGNPGSCDTDLNNINAIAASGYSTMPSIRTFVIGVGDSLTALNGIAAAGGTNMAYLVDTGGNANQQFLLALQDIQGTALTCAYTIPTPTMGTPDYNSVNVQYTPGNGGAPQIIPHVNDAGSCPANGNAWYYDNPSAPTQILLCTSACNTISTDLMGKIDIVLGCATVPA